ncbi:uncharacterized protein LOC114268880 [Camellia sinensis]|uniref:uncharacterized protein LOC114268880 n=1 Tax=Camellia sinensis TaxID=4442 RepID=UPI001035B057|nr:uncharacterized protein LOC114268880 [Camellia sinensis]
MEVFAWLAYDTPGLNLEFACHKLNINPSTRPIVQKIRRSSVEHTEAVIVEVEKLLASGAIRKVQYPQWLSNTVVVKKKNGKLRVCIDFTCLNKACPKDSFPLPRIDQLVDSTAGHGRMSFLDAYCGYHQIPLFGPDQEKTTFITPRGTYCYKVMPFGLKKMEHSSMERSSKSFVSTSESNIGTLLQARRSTGDTPYPLTYGLEAVIPLEVGLSTLRSELFESTSNKEAIAQALDMAKGRREAALIRLVANQQQLIKSFNQKVFPRQFTLGELVLRKVMDHKRVPGEGKLRPNWEGPYKVTVVTGNRAYYLEDLKGRAIPRPWNVANLKKYYQ